MINSNNGGTCLLFYHISVLSYKGYKNWFIPQGKAMAEFNDADREMVWTLAHTTPAVDVRVFMEPPWRERPGLYGLDALLTTPEILAEFFRRRAFLPKEIGPDPAAENELHVQSLTPSELADIVWRHLFVDNPPISEPVRIVMTTLGMYGMDVSCGDLRELREKFATIPDIERREKALELANVDMVLFPVEALAAEEYCRDRIRHRIYRPVLSLTDLFAQWKESARILRQHGYGVKFRVDEFSLLEVRRFLAATIEALSPAAIALDWPEGGHSAGDGCVGRLVREMALPLCRETGLAFFLETGAARLEDIKRLWEEFPDVRFLLFPGGEEQFAPTAVEAFNSRNILLCGPDQPLSFPRILGSYAGLRLETLGSMFHACHSGASVPEALVGCWAHMRWTVGKALVKHYTDLWRTGWRYGKEDVRQDVMAILGGNVRLFLGIGEGIDGR